MKISTKAWHYRFMHFMAINTYHRRNLCSYMRGLVLAGAKCFIFSITGAFVAVFAGLVLGALWADLLGFSVNETLYTVSCVVWGMFTIFLVTFACKEFRWHSRFWYVFFTEKQFQYKEPSPILQWAHDKHDKVCRMIEFEED